MPDSTKELDVNNVSKGLETAMMNENREAVIKGKILPSASKCIKLACITGLAWAISPAIAIIGAIGGFACTKKLRAKERQIIVDDIDIELKMCERYIRQAEDEGDLKKVRQLEIIQRNLKRQQQRIKYSVKQRRNEMKLCVNYLMELRAKDKMNSFKKEKRTISYQNDA